MNEWRVKIWIIYSWYRLEKVSEANLKGTLLGATRSQSSEKSIQNKYTMKLNLEKWDEKELGGKEGREQWEAGEQ